MEFTLEAGREEKRLAEQAGAYHEEVLAITVIVEGRGGGGGAGE